MKKVLALRACRRSHRRGGPEQQSPSSGFVCRRGTGDGLWWELYFDSRRSEPSNRANGCPVLVTTTKGLRPEVIAGQADYTPARPLEFIEGEPMVTPCPHCAAPTKKFGRTKDGRQKVRCLTCRKVSSEQRERPLGEMRLPLDRALLCLNLLCEGSSVQVGGEEGRRYAPPRLKGQEKITVSGSPDEDKISTSHVERANWTLRGHLRRFTRLSNGSSRKKANLRAALALYFAYYNFCRMHKSIRMTSAMAAGVARRPWSLTDLLNAAQSAA